jgi:hypothetical protein
LFEHDGIDQAERIGTAVLYSLLVGGFAGRISLCARGNGLERAQARLDGQWRSAVW